MTDFILSMQLPAIFAAMKGEAWPTHDTTVICPAPLFTPPWLDASTGGTHEQRQAAFDRANQDPNAILYLATDKTAALLVATHAYNDRETRGDRQKENQELEYRYRRDTDKSILALQAALAAATIDPNDDRDHCTMKAQHLRNELTAVKEPIAKRHFKDVIVQGLPEKYRDISLMTYEDPDFNLLKIQAIIRHLYMNDVSRSKRKGGQVAGRCPVMSVESGPGPNSIICHSCGKTRYYKSDCAVLGKNNDKRGNGHPGKSRKPGGKAIGTSKKCCSVHKTTACNDTDSYKQGAPRPKEGGMYSATVVGAQSHPAENDEKLAINFNDDFDGCFQFEERMNTRSKKSVRLGSLEQLHCPGSPPSS